MPGMDGFETAKLIRGRDRSRHIPIIFLTAREIERSQVEEGYALGAGGLSGQATHSRRASGQGARLRGVVPREAAGEARGRATSSPGTRDDRIRHLHARSGRQGGHLELRVRSVSRATSRKRSLASTFRASIWPRPSRQDWPAHVLKVAAARGRFEGEGWSIAKDGSQFWANVVLTALRDEAGSFRGFSKVTRDLTERKHSELGCDIRPDHRGARSAHHAIRFEVPVLGGKEGFNTESTETPRCTEFFLSQEKDSSVSLRDSVSRVATRSVLLPYGNPIATAVAAQPVAMAEIH